MNAAGRPLNSNVDARGTRRRLEALAALGWAAGAIGAHIGNEQTVVSRWMRAERVTRATADKVAAVYEILSNTHPPTDTHGQRLSRARTIARARRLGYALPIEWNDIDTDEAPARPAKNLAAIDTIAVELAVTAGARVRLTTTERQEAVRQLHARGHSDRRIAEMLDVADRTIFRDREALGLPPAVTVDHRPIIRELAA
ncbi:MAG: hypothetical protein PIR02_16110 [Microbacterium enclense]